MKTPSDYNLPHGKWRKGQEESIKWILPIQDVGFMEAPTGSGKTACAAAVSSRKSVVALSRTKFLQESNYEREYGFDAHYGCGNYVCVHPDADRGTTAAECLHTDEGMYKCPHATECEYLLSKARAAASPKVALNYAYWLSARWGKHHAPSVLFLDECHNLPEIVTEWAGCTVTEKQRIDWGLEPLPSINHERQSRGLFIQIHVENPIDKAVKWLSDARSELRRQYANLRRLARSGDERARKRLVKCERLGHKLANTLTALQACPDDWFVRSGPSRTGFKLVVKPLTARHHFANLFLNEHATVAMSATIGNIDTFAKKGLGVDNYSSRVVPSRFPAEDRPITILDVPGMGRKATEADFGYQADAIATAIKEVNPSWPGLILVTRKREAGLLAERLAHRGLQDRVWVTPGTDGYVSTDTQLRAWENRKRKVSNSLCITWAFWEGFNGLDERTCIVAKVPYPYLGSDFERARMQYDGKMYLQRTAWQLCQGLGRTRRGREEDYGPDAGLVAIADGNWTRVQKYMTRETREVLECR